MKVGPIETVFGKGQTVQIYKSQVITKGQAYDSFRLIYYRGGRKRERAKSLNAAKERARILIEELAGNADQNPFTPDERRVVDSAIQTLAPLDIPLSEAARRLSEAERILSGRGTVEEAARFLVQQQNKRELPVITFGELYREFMDTLMTEEVPGKIKSRVFHRSFRYWQDSSQRLGAAAVVFKTRKVADISTRELEAFLDKIPQRRTGEKGVAFTGEFSRTSGRTRNNYRGALCTIFSFARKRGYLPRGVETEAEHILVAAEVKTKKERADGLQRRIYTPAEIQKILDELPDRWITFVVLGSFAGIRAAEIHRLDWRDINFEDAIITVEKDQAKVGKRRIVRMSPQLVAWLKPHTQKEGWVCPHYAHDSTLNIEFAKARSKIAVPMVPNGHRHSYASYRLTEIKVPSEVAWEMNTSERKLKDNYLALVNDRELTEWKKVLPKKQTKKPTVRSASSSRQ